MTTDSLDNPVPLVTSNALSNVIYTSGSTGRPKGVMIRHQGLANYLKWLQREFPLASTDRVLQNTPISFDISILEMFWPLQTGAQLEMSSPGAHRSVNEIADVVRHRGVTVLQAVPSMLGAIVQSGTLANLHSLRRVFTAGEALGTDLVRRFHSETAAELINGYGPTETTVYSTFWRCEREGAPKSIPIGRPVANTHLRILDALGNPVPIGVAGELHIGGDGLARGYLNRPELTAERFVADPFTSAPGARMYRTGDLVRYLPDGNIEFLGRIDHQVKLRGFRIELGEIEAVLAKQPAVREAVVQLREDTPGDKRLVAYIVTHGEMPATADLRAALKTGLPDYMVPAAFVQLPAIPLTPNGKLDRKALPAPPTGSALSQSEVIAPRDNIERHLVAIWEILLNLDSVGVQDNFFDLGGHSLLAVQLMDQIEKNFRKRLPMDSLWFHGGTIESLATLLRDEFCATENPELMTIKSGTRRPLFVIHSVGGNLWHYYEMSRHLAPDQAVYGLQARGVFGTGEPDISVEAIAARSIVAMRAAQPEGPYMIAGYSSGGVIAYEMAQQLARAGEPVALLGLIDSYCPQRMTIQRWFTEFRLLMQQKGTLRQIQELIYFFALHHLKLEHLRKINSVGEAQRWAHWRYRPAQYELPVEFFIIDASFKATGDETLGWSRWLKGNIRLHRLPGNHQTFIKRPIVLKLAAKLQSCIDGATVD